MIRDIDNMGYNDVTIQIKSDQEPAIVAVQEYVRMHRSSPPIPFNSPVGESECNGRVENAIRRVKKKGDNVYGTIGRWHRRENPERGPDLAMDGEMGGRVYIKIRPWV